jgi:polysaccharide biosynthesis transport protein
MRNETSLGVLWRRRWVVISTCLVSVLVAAFVSRGLDKVYETSATMLISLPENEQTFDTVQASQALARSYADIIDSRNIARRVGTRIGLDSDSVLDAASFEAVPETQLLKVQAEANDPSSAAAIANAYADVFIDYADRQLAPNTKARISLAESAPVTDQPVRPRPLLYSVVAGLLGFGLGAALAFLRQRLDRRIRSFEEVEAKLDLPVLGRIPRRARSTASRNAFDESFRILRTNLQFAGPSGRPRSIAVTSARDGEGKTTVVSALAKAGAETGIDVVAVEADLRRPALARGLVPQEQPLAPRALAPGGSMNDSHPGLSSYLVGGLKLEEIIESTDSPMLKVVRAGPLPPSPSAILESPRADAFVGELTGRAELVLIDCPPLNVAADASVVSRWVDGVILVVDLERSTDRAVHSALRQLEAVNARLLGLVLNRDPEVGIGAYSEYYYATEPSESLWRSERVSDPFEETRRTE